MKTIVVTQSPLTGARIGNRPLRIGEFVPAAAMTARRVSSEELQDPHGLEKLYLKRSVMTRTLGSALPLKTELKNGLTYHLRRLNRDIARFEHTPDFDLPTLDPSFLSWKTQAGFPAFSIFRLDSDTSTVSFGLGRSRMRFMMDMSPVPEELQLMIEGAFSGLRSSGQSEESFDSKLTVSPAIPEIMAKYYLDENLHQSLEALCDDRHLRAVELTAKYGGVMPDSVRENIHKWSSVPRGQPCFDDIVIVAEAPEESWKLKEIPRGDPLVIGVAHGLLWLIDAYDLTPFERFASELCANDSSSKKVHN